VHTQAKFRSLLEAAPDAIVGVDAEGRIALANTRAEELFGYPREELLGQPLDLLVPDDAKHIHPTWRAQYFRNPRPRPMGVGMELAGRRKDGTEFPAEISLSALDTEEGRIVSAAVRDVTERKAAEAERERLKAQAERERLEARMHQSQRLESLGQLAGGVAHDFNNLLAVILNYTIFLSEEIERAAAEPGGERWAAAHGDLEQVRRAAERATELTHQLLAFGRREIVDPKPLNVTGVVHNVERLLRRTIGEHVELDIMTGARLRSVMADRGQIEQVLVNLAVNARDAMPGGGVLRIATENLDVDAEYAATRPGLEPGSYVRLTVADTGAGMDREVVERAFEPFYTTKPKGEGSGLGLATVHGIVTQAGGHIELTSEVGVGTEVTVLLPVSEREPSTEAPRPATEPSPGGETVLVVDDEEALRQLAARILTRHGYTVLVAGSGEEAIELARSHEGEIHLLLTDVVMPRMLGKEVAEQVLAVRPRIRVLYMSGYAQPVLASQGTLDDGVELMEKPFTGAGLLARLRSVLDTPGSP
jgi:PAS domain S-box-containing protein